MAIIYIENTTLRLNCDSARQAPSDPGPEPFDQLRSRLEVQKYASNDLPISRPIDPEPLVGKRVRCLREVRAQQIDPILDRPDAAASIAWTTGRPCNR